MIPLPNGGSIIEHINELPHYSSIDVLFGDFETTSRNDLLDSLNVWFNCWALGFAFTVDEQPGAYYAPLRHRSGNNLPLEPFIDWYARVLEIAKRWTNHNIKYDVHVSCNDLGVMPDGELFDTVTHAKIIDSDRGFRGGYGLDALSKAWLGEDISVYENEIKRWLNKRQDYGVVPILPMGIYACQDVITNRRLYKYIEQRRPVECNEVAAMETELTRVLVDMERVGLCVDRQELQLREIDTIGTMLDYDAELSQILGRTINPCSGDDVYDVLINQYGLPILEWTDENDEGEPTGNASFDKNAMKKYLSHPYAPKRVVELIAEYRRLSTHRSLFLEKYQALQASDGRLHASYNQCVRTGRMGCREPNAQQLDKKTKELIHPPVGWSFLSADFAQLEFKVIVHYINDIDCIRAYNENPDTDFHQWVADMAGMKRQPAKTMNFMMGYGGGKKKAIRTLSVDADIVGGIDKMIESNEISESQKGVVFEEFCKQKGEQVYNDYHNLLPTLKPTSRRAAATCYERGYVFNLHGRRRHLPQEFVHQAFNSVCQGEAADIQKERTVFLHRALRDTRIQMAANVHDATVLQAPTEIIEDRRTKIAVAWILENPAKPLRVPLRVSLGTSSKHWNEADKSAVVVHYTQEELQWLRETPVERLFDHAR